nr:hydrogenase iron-sulfur subunit [Desulfobacula sp.]
MNHTPKLTLFHCRNSFEETCLPVDGCEIKTVPMACSSMTRDIHLLKAFEAGADAVLVLVCPGKSCRHTEGSLRAGKRVDYVKPSWTASEWTAGGSTCSTPLQKTRAPSRRSSKTPCWIFRPWARTLLQTI